MKIPILILIGLLAAGYAQASEHNTKSMIEDIIMDRSSFGIVSPETGKTSDFEDLLSEPLSEDAVITLAFINSPVIKGHLSKLGISDAQLRESGILPNPEFSYSTRKSNEDGAGRNVEIEIKQDIMALLLRPIRQRISRSEFQSAQYEIALEIMDHIKEVRLTYLEWLAAMHKDELADDELKAQEASFEIVRRQKEAGNINALHLAEAKVHLQQAKIERLKTSQETRNLTERLRTILGLGPDQFFMQEKKVIPDMPQETFQLADLENQALDLRLDLRIKRQEIKTLENSRFLSRLELLPELEVGLSREKEAGGHVSKGISVEGQIPLFNRKQAQRLGIQAAVQTSRFQLEAMEQQVRLEVRLNYQNLLTSRQMVEAYLEALPVYQQMVKETLYQYNFMLTDVFHLLESKQEELQARKEYVDALKTFWATRIALEHAIGARLGNNGQGLSHLNEHMSTTETQLNDHNHGG